MAFSTAPRRVIRASAGYDLLTALPLALPWTAAWSLDGVVALHRALGLAGQVPRADDVATLLFGCLMASLVAVWAVLRLVRPTLRNGLADTVARVLFSLNFVVAVLSGATPLVLAFLIAEVGWLIVQGVAVAGALRRGRSLDSC